MQEMGAITCYHGNSGRSWDEGYGRACYASEAVVHLLDEEGFASAEVGRLFSRVGSFMSRVSPSNERSCLDEGRFLGAVMAKLAERGMPAPCSLRLERYILQKARDVGLLTFEESVSCGKIMFACTPLLNNLDLMLKICCVPELLVEDSDVDLLLRRHYALMGGSEQKRAEQFFEKLLSVLPYKRLALFVVPCRSMVQGAVKEGNEFGEDMDFLVQIYSFKRRTMLKIAISLGSGFGSSYEKDGWIVKRFGSMAQAHWESEIRKLAVMISYAVPEEVLTAARLIRELSLEQRRALQELVALPVAEAQLALSVAGMIYMGTSDEIVVGNPQGLDLKVVVEAVQETIDALSTLYGISRPIKLRLEDGYIKGNISFEYCFYPAVAGSSGGRIAPVCSYGSYRSIQFSAYPRPVDQFCSDNARKALRFALNNVLRIWEFMEDQERLIVQMLSFKGTIGLLKQGSSTSVVYRLASMLQPGATLVVVPAIHTARNQEYDLAKAGIHRIRVVSGLQEHEARRGMFEDNILTDYSDGDIIILSADAFMHGGVRSYVEKGFSDCITFTVFDEAHTVSCWSQGFMPEYLNAVRLVKDMKKSCLVALTSSSSRMAILDIIKELGLDDLDCIVESKSFEDRNRRYKLHRVTHKNRVPVFVSALKAALREYGWQGSGLVICAEEDDPKVGLIGLAQSIRSYLDVPVGVCSLEPPKKILKLGESRESWAKASSDALRQFESGDVRILVCSRDSAVGLNRTDIRFVLHVGVPESLDEFCLQSGRAGLDSSCIILYWDSSVCEGDINCAQSKELPGRVMEKRVLVWAVSKLFSAISDRSVGDGVSFEVSCSDIAFLRKGYVGLSFESKERLLKTALYRLQLLGVIDGWEGKRGSFKVVAVVREVSYILENYKNLVGRYELEGNMALNLPKVSPSNFVSAVMRCACRLVDYSYYKIKARKEEDRAKMVQALESLESLRDSLLDFSSRSRIKAELSVASEGWLRVLDGMGGLDEMLDLYLACKWKIGSEPDNYAVQVILGFCAVAFENGQENIELVKGFEGLKEALADRAEVARQILSHADMLIPSKRGLVLDSIWQADPSLEVSRVCYERASFFSEVHYSSLFGLVNGILGDLEIKFKKGAISNE